MGALAYRPSAVARALVTGYSRTIALLVSDIANPFYPQLAKSIEREARKAGYALVICNTEDSVEEASAYVQRMLDAGVDGMIHASVGQDEKRVLELIPDYRRIVFANRRPLSPDVSYVAADNKKGAAMLVRHLAEQGHRRIGFIGGRDSNARERLDGFLRATKEAGLEGLVAKGDFSVGSAAIAIDAWLETGAMPTAVIAFNDTVAFGAMSALLAHPDYHPVAFAGFDDIELAGLQVIGLTSVAQHTDEMGVAAVRLLLRQLRDQAVPPVRRILKPTLHVRQSTTGGIGNAGELSRRLAMALQTG
jgi:DNA-binding LacI/PurR family transcriptional regulator